MGTKDIGGENAVRPKTKEGTIEAIKKAVEYHEVSDEVKDMLNYIIDQDLNQGKFDIVKDYDGCTAISDNEPHVNLACFIHDYLFKAGYSLTKANKIFYLVMKEIQTGGVDAKARWLGVTIASGVFFHWRNVFKRKAWKAPALPEVFQMYLNK